MSDMNRRNFLITTAATAAATGLALHVLNGSPAYAADSTAGADTPPKSSTGVDVGALSSFSKDGVTDTFAGKGKGEFFLIRQDSKLYASSSICTHKNCVLQKTSDDLYCKCHRSHFGFEGTPHAGPAKSSLVRYAISTDASGKVHVDKSKSFTEKQWDDPASFVKVSA
jgi:Rieske Fe-S protein